MSFITSNDGQFVYFDTQLRSPNWKGKSVLDFGGNIGNVLHHPRSTIDRDKYWCIDVSVDAIVAGKRAAPEAHFIFYDRYNFEYNPDGIRNLAIPTNGNRFDFVLALSVFTHSPKTEMIEMVNSLEGVLNEGGRLAFTFFDPNYFPPGSNVSNLRYYLRYYSETRGPDLSESEIDAQVDRVQRRTLVRAPERRARDRKRAPGKSPRKSGARIPGFLHAGIFSEPLSPRRDSNSGRTLFPAALLRYHEGKIRWLAVFQREQIEKYEQDGFVHPIRIMSTDEARQFRAGFEKLETLLGRKLEYAAMTHLFFRWAFDLSTQPTILNAVQAILGPEVLVQATLILCKHAA